MNLRWYNNLPQERQEDFRQLVLNSSTLLRRLREILVEDELVLSKQETSLTDFDDPSWHYKQAFRNGDRNRIRKLLDLLDFQK